MQTFPLPREKLTDKDGYMHPTWQKYFSRFFQQMQAGFNDEGIVIPHKSTSDISELPASKSGNIVYDNTTHTVKVNLNGTVKTVTTS